MITLAIVSLALFTHPFQERVQSLTGNIKHHNGLESKILGNRRNVAVYLPPDYEKNPTRRYPVLYMNDGQNVFDGKTSYIPNMEWRADETAERLISDGRIEPIIIVAVDNGQMARADEYLPTRKQTQFAKDPIGGKADRYGDMLQRELMPLINSTYRTKTGPTNTGIMGSSFGGVVSFYLATTRPSVYGRAAVLSPSVWWDDRVLVKQAMAWKKKPAVKMWLDMGTKEGYQGLRDARALKHALLQKGFAVGRDLQYMEDTGAQHNEAAWARRMEPVLLFLYGKA